jgi:GGDEF domain-containing protein
VDEIARTGTEEFSVLLHATDASRASIWAERFEDAFAAAGESYIGAPLTCSLGAVDTEEEPTLMQAATRAERRMTVIRTVRKLRRAHEGD